MERGQNGSFENTPLTPWGFQSSAPPTQPMARSVMQAHSGSASLRVTGGYANASVFQSVTAGPGLFRHSAWYYSDPSETSDGTLVPYWAIFDAADKVIRSVTGDRVQLSATAGSWAEIQMIEHLPDNAVRVRCEIAAADIGATEAFFLDDIAFTQVAP